MAVKDTSLYLSSGITLLNCGLTDNPFCAFRKGLFHLIVGESMGGKTWLAMQLFAEAAKDESFKEHRFIFDQPEDGALMDVGAHFGKKTESRLEYPMYDSNGEPISSETLEEMYSLAKKEFKAGPCIRFVDSHDALTCLAEKAKAEKIDKAIENETEVAGIMADGKAKVNSAMLRQIKKPMMKHGSMLFMISQLRDNLGIGFEKKSRSGGKSLRFYASTEMWLVPVKKLTKSVRGKDREIGNLIQITVKKNRNSSQRPSFTIPLIHDYGFDDIGSCVDWLRENHWSKGKRIDCPEFFNKPVTRDYLVSAVEEKEVGIEKLQKLVGKVWRQIRKELKPDRKQRYV